MSHDLASFCTQTGKLSIIANLHFQMCVRTHICIVHACRIESLKCRFRHFIDINTNTHCQFGRQIYYDARKTRWNISCRGVRRNFIWFNRERCVNVSYLISDIRGRYIISFRVNSTSLFLFFFFYRFFFIANFIEIYLGISLTVWNVILNKVISVAIQFQHCCFGKRRYYSLHSRDISVWQMSNFSTVTLTNTVHICLRET